jgi:transcriptional regulator with XRE-family HTH domain
MPRPFRKTSTQQTLSSIIGSNCRTSRLRLRLTQEDVAQRVGIATEVYGRLERGLMTPSVSTLYKVCCVLRISADAALGLDDAAVLPDVLDASRVHRGSSGSPAHRRLMYRAQQLPNKYVRLLGLMATALCELVSQSKDVQA